MAFLRAGAAQRVRSLASVIVIVLLLLSTTGVAGWLWFLFHIPPDTTRVSNLQDDGTGSLRWAISLAPSKSTTTFDTSLHGTILLTSGDLDITKNLTIRGPGGDKLSISGGKSGHDVHVLARTTVAISGLTFKDSNTSFGIIYNEGTLILSNSTISGNTSDTDGGGILNAGILTLNNSTVSGNTALSGEGGGIATSDTTSNGPLSPYGVEVVLYYDTVYGNIANVGGGIWMNYLNKKSMGLVSASIIAGNSAHTGPNIAGHLDTEGYNLVGDRSGLTLIGPPEEQSTDRVGVPLTNLGIDPVLRDNGGSTNPHTLTHALLPGSPAIDAIPLQYCQIQGIFNQQSRMNIDQRGMKRPDGNEQFCDIGAFESSP